MSERPKIRLSRLRDIGWANWDPIGLLDEEATWEGKPFADEYDGYLLRVANMVRTEVPEEEIIDYLVHSEIDHMGLGLRDGIRGRAQSVINAIRNEKELWNWPDSD